MSDIPLSHILKPRPIKPPLEARCELCEKIVSVDEMVLQCPSCLKTFHVSCLKSYLEVNGKCPSCKGSMVFLPPSMPSNPEVLGSKTLSEPKSVPVSMSISLRNSFSLTAYVAGLVGGIFALLSGIFISMIVFYIPFEPASEYIVQMPSNFMLIISAVMSLANLIIGYLIVVNSGRIRRGQIYGGATNLALGIIIFFVLNITFDTLQEFFFIELLWSLLVRTPIFTTIATLISGALGIIAHAGTLTREVM